MSYRPLADFSSPEAAPRGQYLLRLAHCRTVAPINRSEKPYINNIAPRADLCIAIFELSIKRGFQRCRRLKRRAFLSLTFYPLFVPYLLTLVPYLLTWVHFAITLTVPFSCSPLPKKTQRNHGRPQRQATRAAVRPPPAPRGGGTSVLPRQQTHERTWPGGSPRSRAAAAPPRRAGERVR